MDGIIFGNYLPQMSSCQFAREQGSETKHPSSEDCQSSFQMKITQNVHLDQMSF